MSLEFRTNNIACCYSIQSKIDQHINDLFNTFIFENVKSFIKCQNNDSKVLNDFKYKSKFRTKNLFLTMLQPTFITMHFTNVLILDNVAISVIHLISANHRIDIIIHYTVKFNECIFFFL